VSDLALLTLAASFTTADVWLLVAVGVLLLITMLAAGAETALTRMPKTRAQVLAAEGRRGADTLVGLVSHPDQFVNPVLLVVLVCQLVQATLVGVVADRQWGVTGIVVATAVDVVVVFVLAASAPRTWAVLNPDRAALIAARPVAALVRFPPLRLTSRALIGLTNIILPGKGLKQGPYVSEEELLAVAELGVEEGVIEEDERALIESIIEFGDTVVREVMVPRPDMVTVPSHFRVADVMEVVLLNGYSRLPVSGEGIDDVIGIVYAKDLMRAERDGKEGQPVAGLVRPARYVPETKRVPDMLREMQGDKFHMAIVVDEYGGTAGLVTLEDIIEELVGEIVDEFDVEDPLVEPLAGGGVRVDARTPLDEVNDLLKADLPEGDWDTIGGLLYNRLGHVPVEGETVEIDGWQLTAQRIQGRRIGRVRLTPVGDQRPQSPGRLSTEGGRPAMESGVNSGASPSPATPDDGPAAPRRPPAAG
jgi:CBS domain containing-hemolysin-like protein